MDFNPHSEGYHGKIGRQCEVRKKRHGESSLSKCQGCEVYGHKWNHALPHHVRCVMSWAKSNALTKHEDLVLKEENSADDTSRDLILSTLNSNGPIKCIAILNLKEVKVRSNEDIAMKVVLSVVFLIFP
jgi:hypothetical protein